MESIFETFFTLLFQIIRFFLHIIFEVIIEGLIRGTGYCVVSAYRLRRHVDIESTEVFIVGFITWGMVIFLAIYFFLLI
ncbi:MULTISPECIES: hypothetical protein [Acinetobacter]|uniref:Uncharacterized protein n=1 Tax=Acinetobacter junii SH205 TaxID=575587 RepID=D0SQX0_ACIJU|nr:MULTISPECIES: hypothetical protein [Acinetobacter]MBY3625825.1 hypothetical protein [Acinetobacter sp. CUI P1]AWA49339.1 hypothetical protein CDG57_15985 [Acinetobacter junii]EEY91585.1 hypothetical protein HMPREF0026_02880 [Acinetobacter junii SH205]ENV65256.1 hypothetical protein F948_03131 [Acinetobacter junii CIP 64.5]MBL8281767.1 hypothetical protein [Acinetobacter junii]